MKYQVTVKWSKYGNVTVRTFRKGGAFKGFLARARERDADCEIQIVEVQNNND